MGDRYAEEWLAKHPDGLENGSEVDTGMEIDLKRIVVVGTSCSGKSTLSQRLAVILNQPCIELDALHWAPNWTPRPVERFYSDVKQAITAERWIVDGNYNMVRNILLQQATALIWLNYGFSTVFSRALLRTIRRALFAEKLFSGNRETMARSFFSRESISGG